MLGGIRRISSGERRVGTLAQAMMLGRFAAGLPGFLSSPVTSSDAREHLAQGLARRAERFLQILTHAVLSTSDSPYRRLLVHAGIGRADVVALLNKGGLEATLEALYDLVFTYASTSSKVVFPSGAAASSSMSRRITSTIR